MFIESLNAMEKENQGIWPSLNNVAYLTYENIYNMKGWQMGLLATGDAI